MIGSNNIMFTPKMAFGICLLSTMSDIIASNMLTSNLTKSIVASYWAMLGKCNVINFTIVNRSPPPSKVECASVVFIGMYMYILNINTI